MRYDAPSDDDCGITTETALPGDGRLGLHQPSHRVAISTGCQRQARDGPLALMPARWSETGLTERRVVVQIVSAAQRDAVMQ